MCIIYGSTCTVYNACTYITVYCNRILTDDTILSVTIKGDLVPHSLKLLDTGNSKQVDKVAFGKIYYGHTIRRKFLLYNNSPATTDYIVLLDESAVGSEKGVDMSEGLSMACSSGGLAQRKWREQGHSPNIDSLIQVSPSQVLIHMLSKHLVSYIQPSQGSCHSVSLACM